MKKISALLCTLLILLAISLPVQADESGDISSFIIELVNNIDWSEKSVETVVVGIVGESQVKAELEKLAASNDKVKIEIKEKAFTDDLTDCHIVYTDTDQLSQLAKILKQANRSKIITLAHAKDFARYGVMINLIEEDSKMKCEVNKMVMDECGVKINDKILKNAIII